MGIVEESFSRLFPGADFGFEAQVSYSGKFKPYNAIVRRAGNFLHFSLSRTWKNTSDEIVIGLIQHLLVKILRKEKFYRSKVASLNMQLYDDFIKGMSDVIVPSAAGQGDERLEMSFKRVNEKYFLNLMEKPNLAWGSDSFRKLASYEYHTNSVTVSTLFTDAPENLLDYLVYHELLHKKLKFSSSNGRTRHHSAEFRKLETAFDASGDIEGKLNAFVRQSRRASRPKQHLTWRQMLMFR